MLQHLRRYCNLALLLGLGARSREIDDLLPVSSVENGFGALATCEQSEDLDPSYIFQCGYNYVPNTFNVLQSPSFSNCYNSCQFSKNCEGFVFDRVALTCSLKKGVPNRGDGAVADPRFDYGAKFDTCSQLNDEGTYRDYQVECGRAWLPYGNDLGRQENGTFASCAAACDANTSCRIFNWGFYVKRCYLNYGTSGGPAPTQGGFEEFYDYGVKQTPASITSTVMRPTGASSTNPPSSLESCSCWTTCSCYVTIEY